MITESEETGIKTGLGAYGLDLFFYMRLDGWLVSLVI